MSRSTTSGGQKGRAASWTSTASPFDRGQAGADGVARSVAAIDQRSDVEAGERLFGERLLARRR